MKKYSLFNMIQEPGMKMDSTKKDAQIHNDLPPRKLSFKWKDYPRVLYCWMRAFRKTLCVEPGLYFTGNNYDINTPLLTTGNNLLTVFMVWRAIRNRNLRILIVDTEGINVWCASGKGQFSAERIMEQIDRYPDHIISEDTATLILPKLSLSGVSLAKLRKYGIKAKIGPVYASELPAYLDEIPFKNRNKDVFRFSLKDRLFTLLPTLLQMIKYALFISAGLFIWHVFFKTKIYWQVLPVMILITIIYIIFFYILPTKKFTVKGLFLFILMASGFSAYYFIFNRGKMDFLTYLFLILFSGGANLLFALSYTGDSGVSNYSLVRREVAVFLPVTALFFLGAASVVIIKGVLQ